MILADVEKVSDGLTSLEGKYVNVYKKIIQIEKSKTSQQTTGDFYWGYILCTCCMIFLRLK